MTSKILLSVLVALTLGIASVRAAEDDSAILSALGATTGQSVLVTHLAIGTLADAYVGKMYKSEQATSIVTTYIKVTKGMKEHMIKLIDAGTLNRNDQEFVKNTVDVLDLVLREGDDLRDYIASGKQNDAQAYDGSRKKAWKAIQTLLNIKD